MNKNIEHALGIGICQLREDIDTLSEVIAGHLNTQREMEVRLQGAASKLLQAQQDNHDIHTEWSRSELARAEAMGALQEASNSINSLRAELDTGARIHLRLWSELNTVIHLIDQRARTTRSGPARRELVLAGTALRTAMETVSEMPENGEPGGPA